MAKRFLDPDCKIKQTISIFDTVNKVPNEVAFQWKHTLQQNNVVVQRCWNKNPEKGEHARNAKLANNIPFINIVTVHPIKTLVFNRDTLCSNTSMVDDLISRKTYFENIIFDDKEINNYSNTEVWANTKSETISNNYIKLEQAGIPMFNRSQDEINYYIDNDRLEDDTSAAAELSNYSLKKWFRVELDQNFYNTNDLEQHNFYTHYQQKKISDA